MVFRGSQAKWGLILEDDILALVPHAEEVVARAVKSLPEDWDALFLGYHDDAGRPHPAISREADAEIEVGPCRGKFSGGTFGGAWFLNVVITRSPCRLNAVLVCNFQRLPLEIWAKWFPNSLVSSAALGQRGPSATHAGTLLWAVCMGGEKGSC